MQNENSAAQMTLCITLLSGFLLMDDLMRAMEETSYEFNKSIPKNSYMVLILMSIDYFVKT